ncbi:MAG: hypothetical protein ACP5N2_00865 [Candidatus Nanoarchaeia archaeon]
MIKDLKYGSDLKFDIDATADRYSKFAKFSANIQSNYEQVWKFKDDNLARIETLALEEKAAGGIYSFRHEVIESDSVRKKLAQVYRDIFTSTIEAPYAWKKPIEKICASFVAAGIMKDEDDARTYFSNIFHFDDLSFKFVLKEIIRQPRTLDTKTYDYLNSASKEEILESLIKGYCKYAFDRYPNEHDAISAMSCLDRGIRELKPVEYNQFWTLM